MTRLGCTVIALAVAAAGCAKMKAAWEAQQQAQAQAQANAQTANMEYLCGTVRNAYCSRCNPGNDCASIYIACLGTASPADASRFNVGEVQQCGVDVGGGDCAVMPQVWPASCSGPTPPPPQEVAQQTTEIQCSGGAVSDGTQCVCPEGTAWDGAQCAAPAVVEQQPAHRGGGGKCRKALLAKGYAPEFLGHCDGVNDRCALAVIGRGYAPELLSNCQGNIDGGCAEAVIKKGYAPDQIVNCRR